MSQFQEDIKNLCRPLVEAKRSKQQAGRYQKLGHLHIQKQDLVNRTSGMGQSDKQVARSLKALNKKIKATRAMIAKKKRPGAPRKGANKDAYLDQLDTAQYEAVLEMLADLLEREDADLDAVAENLFILDAAISEDIDLENINEASPESLLKFKLRNLPKTVRAMRKALTQLSSEMKKKGTSDTKKGGVHGKTAKALSDYIDSLEDLEQDDEDEDEDGMTQQDYIKAIHKGFKKLYTNHYMRMRDDMDDKEAA